MKNPAATVTIDRDRKEVIVVLDRPNLSVSEARELSEALDVARREAVTPASPTWTV